MVLAVGLSMGRRSFPLWPMVLPSGSRLALGSGLRLCASLGGLAPWRRASWLGTTILVRFFKEEPGTNGGVRVNAGLRVWSGTSQFHVRLGWNAARTTLSVGRSALSRIGFRASSLGIKAGSLPMIRQPSRRGSSNTPAKVLPTELAELLDINHMRVARVWAKAALQPQDAGVKHVVWSSLP